MRLVPLLTPLLLLAAAPAAVPRVEGGWVRPPPPGAPVAAAYLTVTNPGRRADRLSGVASPDAERVEIHSMALEGGVMRMRAQAGADLPAGGALVLAPGGLHLMLIAPRRPLKAGDAVPITLSFARAGAVRATLPVRAAAPQ